MTLLEAINERHSVRVFEDRPIDGQTVALLQKYIEKCNAKAKLNFQLVLNEPKAFSGPMAHYGKFLGCKNYIALVGKRTADFEERCGYYGEYLVLKAKQLGLESCWVALTFSKVKDAFKVREDEKLCMVIALGYGMTPGIPHKSKPISEVVKTDGNMPNWFREGVRCALLAPTAMNQQRFRIELKGKKVYMTAQRGPYTKTDLGIVRLHFEIGAGKENFEWGIVEKAKQGGSKKSI